MNTNHKLLVILIVAMIMAAWTLTPTNEDNDASIIATAVEAQLQTQAAEDSAAQGDSPEQADYPAKAACSELSILMVQQMGLEAAMSAGSFNDPESGVDGAGCQLSVGVTGEQISDWGNRTSSFVGILPSNGWESDPNFSGGGAGGELLTIRKGDFACTYISEVRPASPSLCSGNEALAACLDRLDPADIVYGITVGCTPDSYVASEVDPGPDVIADPAIRISFDPGDISAYVNGRLNPLSSQRYVLYAMQGQEMVVSLNMSPPANGIIVVYGDDGTVLISDHATTSFWSGILPLTQDYFISVRSSPDYPISYSMQVIIPPIGDLYTDSFLPSDNPTCQSIVGILGSTMDVDVHTGQALFTDHLTGTAGVGCKITAWGTWDVFPDQNTTSTAVMNALTANGWTEDPQYGAGGAGGFATGFTKNNNLCLYTQLIRELDPWVCDSFSGPIYNCWDAQDDSGMYLEINLNCAAPN